MCLPHEKQTELDIVDFVIENLSWRGQEFSWRLCCLQATNVLSAKQAG